MCLCPVLCCYFWLSIRFEKLVKNGKKPKEKGGCSKKTKKKFVMIYCFARAHSYTTQQLYTAKNLRKRKKILVEAQAPSPHFIPCVPSNLASTQVDFINHLNSSCPKFNIAKWHHFQIENALRTYHIYLLVVLIWELFADTRIFIRLFLVLFEDFAMFWNANILSEI